MQDTTRTEIEAAVFRRLLQHLGERKNVQNVELMNLAGFHRNCLAEWPVEVALRNRIAIGLDEASAEQWAAFGSRAKCGASDA